MGTRVDDAMDGLSARDARELMARLEQRLQVCIIDGADGAVAVSATLPRSLGHGKLALMLCPACIERHRLPQGAATT